MLIPACVVSVVKEDSITFCINDCQFQGASKQCMYMELRLRAWPPLAPNGRGPRWPVGSFSGPGLPTPGPPPTLGRSSLPKVARFSSTRPALSVAVYKQQQQPLSHLSIEHSSNVRVHFLCGLLQWKLGGLD